MDGPFASFSKPSGDLGLYLSDARFLAGTGPEQTEILSIADFDRLVADKRPAFVVFGFYGFPRRGVYDQAKARALVAKLLRQYGRGEWGRFRQATLDRERAELATMEAQK